MPDAIDTGHGIPFREAVRVWVRIAVLSFGGPAAQIAVMHRILVEEKRWIGETRFLHALNYCMLLPGPEAQQLTIYIGWLLHRVRGGVVAGILFVLPGYLGLMALSVLYAGYGEIGLVQGLFFGLRSAVLAIVLQAVIRLSRRALPNRAMAFVAALAFVALFLFGIPFPLVVVGAALIGWLGDRAGFSAFDPGRRADHTAGPGDGGEAALDRALASGLPAHLRPSLGRAIKTGAICGSLWLGPVLALLILLGPGNVFTAIALFFSETALVGFGGAYAILAYVSQQGVEHYGWLKSSEMVTGLGLAETTPGPLVIVLQFVGFMAAFRQPGSLPPMVAAFLGGTLATWTTFAPCFLWVLVGAPSIEALRGNRAINAALTAVTAAIVGVIANLALWFALHTLFGQVTERVAGVGVRVMSPDLATIDVPAVVLGCAAVIALFHFRAPLLPTLAAFSLIGMASTLAGLH
jgi:chromate transporter